MFAKCSKRANSEQIKVMTPQSSSEDAHGNGEGAEDEQEECSSYDAIAMLTSLSSFAQSGRFDILQSDGTLLDINASKELRILAVVGLFNTGKTKLINMLFGKKLRSSKIYATQGLSFIYVPSRKMLVVDTAGIQSTVSFRSRNVEPIVDAKTTEAFLFALISRMTDMLIFVVNDFTWVEQEYVEMFHQKDKLQNKHRELLVLHNLKTTSTEHEARALFDKQIVSCYGGAESHLNKLVYTANSTPPIHHITLCQEGSPAGTLYNKKNQDYIMNLLEFGQGGRKPVILTELLTTCVAELLPKFLLIESLGTQWTIEYEAIETRGSAVTAETDGYMQVGAIATKCSKLTMKTHGVIGPLGETQCFNTSFSPECNIFEEEKEHEIVRIIQIECPGVDEDDVKIEESDLGILVIIDKKKTIDEERVMPVRPITEKHGKFEETFAIENRNFRLCEEEISLDSGILKIVLKNSLGVKKRIQLRKPSGMYPLSNVPGQYLASDSVDAQQRKAISEQGNVIPQDVASAHAAPAGLPQNQCIPPGAFALTPNGACPAAAGVDRKVTEESARLEAERRAFDAKVAEEADAERKAAEESAHLKAEGQALEAKEAEEAEAERKAAEEFARLEAECTAIEAQEVAEADRQATRESARLEAERGAFDAKEVEAAEAERKAVEESAHLEAERNALAAKEAEEAEAERKVAEESVRLEAERNALEAQEVEEAKAERKAVEESAHLEAERNALEAKEAEEAEAERRVAEESVCSFEVVEAKN